MWELFGIFFATVEEFRDSGRVAEVNIYGVRGAPDSDCICGAVPLGCSELGLCESPAPGSRRDVAMPYDIHNPTFHFFFSLYIGQNHWLNADSNYLDSSFADLVGVL